MTDDQKTIAKKIKSHAFSGGGASREEHEANGGNPDIDVAYQYLSFFEDNDEKMETLAKVSLPLPSPQSLGTLLMKQEYRAGTLSTSQMKEACIAKIQEVVAGFQSVCPFTSVPNPELGIAADL